MSRSPASTIRAANDALLTSGDLDAVSEFFTTDYTAHVTDQDIAGGHDAIRRILDMYRSAFSDLSVDVEVLVESDDRVAWQRTFRATHTGTFRGFPATGRPVVWRDMIVSRFHDGRIAEEWVVTDLAEHLLLARQA